MKCVSQQALRVATPSSLCISTRSGINNCVTCSMGPVTSMCLLVQPLLWRVRVRAYYAPFRAVRTVAYSTRSDLHRVRLPLNCCPTKWEEVSHGVSHGRSSIAAMKPCFDVPCIPHITVSGLGCKDRHLWHQALSLIDGVNRVVLPRK